MAAQKRPMDDPSAVHKSKRPKTSNAAASTEAGKQPLLSSIASEEVDFPRGGGTSFTPLEVKAIRAEAVKEADNELFQDSQKPSRTKNVKRKPVANDDNAKSQEKSNWMRVEHLNYKKINIGMKILGQIVSILPLALIVSLPNQLFAHVPITNISSQYTTMLEEMDVNNESGSEDEESTAESRVPQLTEMFHVGQYVRAIVTAVHAPGLSVASALGSSRDELAKASRRVELNLDPGRLNGSIQKTDLKAGFTLTASIKSVEDHGYALNLGVPDVTGFLPFSEAAKGPFSDHKNLQVGRLLDITVMKLWSNGRTCDVSVDKKTFSTSSLSELSSISSILPGALVQCLITAVHNDGIVLQMLGFFEATADTVHLPSQSSKVYKVGKKVKARILYDYSSSPSKFALALSQHIIDLDMQRMTGRLIQEQYPLGTTLEAVKIMDVELERGVFVEVAPRLLGFVHVSHLSDDHVTLSSSGPWKIGSLHRARVTGYFSFDGVLQLSMKASVLDQRFLQVADVHVGEVVKGTIKNLTDSGLFVSLSGNVDGVVWPNHYADITLKHPAKRFKIGAPIKCKVLMVDPDRRRISLTAKKTLVESNLPVLSKFEQVTAGTVTHAVVFKTYDKFLLVEFYNNLKAVVYANEAGETLVGALSESFPVGKVVRVRITSVDLENARIVASIRQASAKDPVGDINAVEIGNTVHGIVVEIHKENAVITLQPSQIRSLLSLKNLANHRNTSFDKLNLNVGDELDDLVVVSRNLEKGFAIVASKPDGKTGSHPRNSGLVIDDIIVGQIVGGRVTRHYRHGTIVKLSSRVRGVLRPTDTSDDYDVGTPFPAIDSIIKAVVIAVDRDKRDVSLSTRPSKLYPDRESAIRDREISGVSDLHVGQTVRGFVKNVAEQGLFVSIGRGVDARVQIRELFDDFVKDWKSRFQVNQLISGRVTSIDPETNKVDMSLRSGDVLKAIKSSGLTITDLHKNQKVDGIVKRIEDYGLFIQIEGSKLSGLCHKSQLSDNQEADTGAALHRFKEGDRVKAVIISTDDRRISMSLKPSFFSNDEFADEENGSDSESNGQFVESDIEMHGDDTVIADEDEESDSEPDVDDVMEIATEDVESWNQQATNLTSKSLNLSHPIAALSLDSGFLWADTVNASDNDSGSASSSDEHDEETVAIRKKKSKRKEIKQDRTADMQTKTPESNADFERLLLGSPNSSYLWIQYMSFQMQISEVDKAREIARRAIRTISFREEQERLNVWIALLNLENVYGSDENLELVFKEAAKANDSKTIHLRLASIFDDSDKPDKADEQYKRTCKKFGQSSKCWTLYCEHLLKRGNIEDARKLLPRSFQSLDKRKHLKTISKFAQLEYKYGDPERGRTLFEGIIDSHPKRWDLWTIYMDMEAVQKSIQTLRNLFDRVLTHKMTSHKAKSFFKKWLDLERRIGDEDGANIVKQKAIEWTQRASKSS